MRSSNGGGLKRTPGHHVHPQWARRGNTPAQGLQVAGVSRGSSANGSYDFHLGGGIYSLDYSDLLIARHFLEG